MVSRSCSDQYKPFKVIRHLGKRIIRRCYVRISHSKRNSQTGLALSQVSAGSKANATQAKQILYCYLFMIFWKSLKYAVGQYFKLFFPCPIGSIYVFTQTAQFFSFKARIILSTGLLCRPVVVLRQKQEQSGLQGSNSFQDFYKSTRHHNIFFRLHCASYQTCP